MSSSSHAKISRGSKDWESKEKKSNPKKRSGESSDEDASFNPKKSKQASEPLTSDGPKGLSIKLKQPEKKKSEAKPQIIKKASVFGESSDSDETEEMPPEARMRMKNIGRDTQTSAGPNSFGKTRQGFCDAKKVFERQLKKAIEESDD